MEAGPLQLHVFLLLLTVFILNRLTSIVQNGLAIRPLPEDDRLRLGTLLDPPFLIIGLFHGHPARISVAMPGQHHRVDSLVDCAGNRVQGTSAFPGLPWLLPGCGTVLQLFDNRLSKSCRNAVPVRFPH